MLWTHILLLPAFFGFSAARYDGAANTPPKALKAFGLGFLCEFENARNSEPQAAASVQRQVNEATTGSLAPIKIEKRLEFTSDIFSGASFVVTAVTGPADDSAFRSALEAVPEIRAVYPMNTYYATSNMRREPMYQWSGDSAEAQLEKRQDPEPDPQTDINAIFSTHVMTGVDKLHAENVTGKGVKVAILDSGIDYLHPALGKGFGPGFKVVGGTDLVGDLYNSSTNRPPKPDPDPITDCHDHGTHVAGIIGASPYKYNVTGVAPDAELEMYRVFGCAGGSSTDVGVNASLQAYNSGADIIHASIGGVGGWSDDAWSVVVDRINTKGRVYTLSAGNSGLEDGIFGANALGGGPNTPLVGSIDNTDSPELLLNATYKIEKNPAVDFRFAAGFPQNFTADLELYALSFDVDDDSDACDELPESTPDLTNRLVLVQRRTRCPTDQKVVNIQKRGGRYILFVQLKDDDPIRPLAWLDYNGQSYEWREPKDGPLLQGIGMVEMAVGELWIDNLRNGTKITATLPKAVGNKELRYQINNQTGGRMSQFTSWGPTYEAQPGVTVSAPGGNILSTLSRKVGGYGVYSGTSMAAPYIAGVAALIKSANPDITANEIRSRLAVTARPVKFNDNTTTDYDFLAPAFQQGGGLVDAYRAVRGTTILNATSLNLNDTAFTNNKQHFTITNSGAKDLHYNLSHIGAGTMYALPEADPDENQPLYFNDERFVKALTKAYATVDISPQAVDIAAGASATIAVNFDFPDLDRRRIPLVSGYIACNASDGTAVTLPYNGIASALRNAVVLDPNIQGSYLIAVKNSTLNETGFLEPAAPGSGSVLSVPKVANTSLLNDVVLPGVQLVLAMGTRRVDFDVLRADDSTNIGTALVLDPRPLYESSYSRNLVYIRLFYGMLANMTYVPEGEYKFLVRALRITGDPKNLDDYDSFTTESFHLRYTEEDKQEGDGQQGGGGQQAGGGRQGGGG